ncbi:MAG: hypothetical protein RLZZ225_878 [Pseudomonadota bacterium]|jgi:flagellar basal body-associated protein FliL
MLLIFENDKSLDLKAFCRESLIFLQEKELADNSNFPINWENLSPEQLKDIIKHLAAYEANNLAFCEKKYQQVKNRTIYGTLGLIIALSLFGIGLILIPAIVSSVVIPFIPVFLLSVAITAFARIFLKLHENYYHTEHRQTKKLLDDLKEIQVNLATNSAEQAPKDALKNEQLSEKIQEMSNDVKDIKQIIQASPAHLMGNNGLFKSTTSAEVSANNENASACYNVG